MTDFDKIADALHRKQVADRFTAEELADKAIKHDTRDHLNMEIANVEDVRTIVIKAVRMARGEDEIL